MNGFSRPLISPEAPTEGSVPAWLTKITIDNNCALFLSPTCTLLLLLTASCLALLRMALFVILHAYVKPERHHA